MPWRKQDRSPAYGKAAWRKARAAQLARDRSQCQIRGPGCLGTASIVDHVFGLAADPQHKHLQSACQVCSDAKTHREGQRSRRRPEPPAEPRTNW